VWQTVTAIAVPIVLGLIGFLGTGGTRLSKRIHHHADLLEKLKGADVASAAMAALLAKEIGWLDAKESARQARKLNWRRVREAFFVALASLFLSVFAFLIAALVNEANSAVGDFAFGCAISVLGFSFYVIGTALSRIFEPKRVPLSDLLPNSDENLAPRGAELQPSTPPRDESPRA
jgi:lipopolysaccharide export LptBFGC system permease protein LptF